MEMTMKKRITALLICALLLLSLSSCGENGVEPASVTIPSTAAVPPEPESVTEVYEPVTQEQTTAPEPVTEQETTTAAATTTAPGETQAETTTEKQPLLQRLSTLIQLSTTAPKTISPPKTTKSVRVQNYTKKQLMDYFVVTALHNENGLQIGRVIKWKEPVKIYLLGNYLEKDVEKINELCKTLNKIDYFPGISITEDAGEANIYMLFAGSAELSKNIENYGLFDDGYCGFVIDARFNIKKCVIGINSGMVNRRKRDSVISEELLQAMGLPNDSDDYRNSIFHRGSDSLASPSNLDWGLAVILYNPGIEAGMNEREARAVMEKFVKS